MQESNLLSKISSHSNQKNKNIPNERNLLKNILNEFQPQRLLQSAIAGAIIAILNITIATAFAMLVFSGELSDWLAAGIGFMLFGQMVLVVLITLFSSFKSAISSVQDAPMVVIGLMAIAILKEMPGSRPEEKFMTVLIAMVLTTILTGIICWLLGHFKWGDFVRYVPYPVIGGFLAGSGVLLLFGAISIMTGEPASLFQLSWLVQPALYIKWVPGVVFGLALILILRRRSHFLIVPVMLFCAIGLFYLVLWATDMTIPQAIDGGHLPKVFSDLVGGLWKPIRLESLSMVNWPALFHQAGTAFALVIISIIAILLNVTALEISTNEKIDLNRELSVTGIANIFAGFGGSGIGFHAIAFTMLTIKINAKSRMVGVLQGVFILLVLLFGGTIFSYFPTSVLCGFLAFAAFDLIVVWLFDSWRKLPRIDYAIIVIITLVMNWLGILEGVGLGLLLTIVQFIVKYSAISMVKHELSGASFRSHVVRPRVFQRLLQQKGNWMYILELQGFLFFGTANELFKRIQERFQRSELLATRYIVLDFRQVSGLDTSAVFSFEKIIQLCRNQQVELILTHLTEEMRRQMHVIIKEYKMDAFVFSDLDHGVEWCENQMIATFESVGLGARQESLVKQLEKTLSGQGDVSKLMQYFEKREIAKDELIIRQGDDQNSLFFIESGSVTVRLEGEGPDSIRIRSMGPGTVVGELGFFLDTKASASVVADEAGTLFSLSRENLKKMEQGDIGLANGFHKYIAGLLSERVVQTTDVLNSFSNG